MIHVEPKLNISRVLICDLSQADRHALTHVEHVYLFVCCCGRQGSRVSVLCWSEWINIDVISTLCR